MSSKYLYPYPLLVESSLKIWCLVFALGPFLTLKNCSGVAQPSVVPVQNPHGCWGSCCRPTSRCLSSESTSWVALKIFGKFCWSEVFLTCKSSLSNIAQHNLCLIFLLNLSISFLSLFLELSLELELSLLTIVSQFSLHQRSVFWIVRGREVMACGGLGPSVSNSKGLKFLMLKLTLLVWISPGRLAW